MCAVVCTHPKPVCFTCSTYMRAVQLYKKYHVFPGSLVSIHLTRTKPVRNFRQSTPTITQYRMRYSASQKQLFGCDCAAAATAVSHYPRHMHSVDCCVVLLTAGTKASPHKAMLYVFSTRQAEDLQSFKPGAPAVSVSKCRPCRAVQGDGTGAVRGENEVDSAKRFTLAVQMRGERWIVGDA